MPENLLRIVVILDAPLSSDREAPTPILIGNDGRRIESAFLEPPQLSTDRRTLTLLFHPGRVKMRLLAHDAQGRALWATLSGSFFRPSSTAERHWTVQLADVEGPRPKRWHLTPFGAGTRTSLQVSLDGPVDRAGGSGLIAVADAAGRRVPGAVVLKDGETRWTFVPNAPWRAEICTLRVHPGLEVPTGNRPCASFDRPIEIAPTCAPRAIGFCPR